VYIHKICEDVFGDCKKSFSWLDQKVNKTMNANDSSTDIRPSMDCAASQQDILTLFSILTEFEATEYLYSIRYLIRIQNFEDIRFNSNEIPDSSHP